MSENITIAQALALAEHHYNKGDLADAASAYRQILNIDPQNLDACCNLALILIEHGKLVEADAELRQILEIKADIPEIHCNLGVVLMGLGRPAEAEATLLRAVSLKPDFAEAYNNLGNARKTLGDLAGAEDAYRKALHLKPDYAMAYCNLGAILTDNGYPAEAEAALLKAVSLKPDFAEAYNNLATLFRGLGRLSEAEAAYRKAINFKPNSAEIYNNLAVVLRGLGRLDEAETAYRTAIHLKPDFSEAYSNLLFMIAYHGLRTPANYLALAQDWQKIYVQQTGRTQIFKRQPLVGRRLRVGYVSGDFRQHAVSYFIEPLFAYHDRAKVEVFAYYANALEDEVTKRLRSLADHWISVAGKPDVIIHNLIESDEIDVLIDLSGHTAHNRLGVFARRAAPVQAHYLGYFASTGLETMDYWIGDEILTPLDTHCHFSEKVWCLPRVWMSYNCTREAPIPHRIQNQDGPVWLGSFNRLGKITPATLALWAKVLHALPEGRLLLKTKELADSNNRQRILSAMADHGIAAYRIELQDRNATPDWSSHMAYYNRLDIVLDPIGGLGGSTTTCDALWMAVPVITLKGDCVASRMTDSLVTSIGHPEWVANTKKEYVEKAVCLARDVKQRSELRISQRKKMAQSPLCNPGDLALHLEEAYLAMYNKWRYQA